MQATANVDYGKREKLKEQSKLMCKWILHESNFDRNARSRSPQRATKGMDLNTR